MYVCECKSEELQKLILLTQINQKYYKNCWCKIVCIHPGSKRFASGHFK